MQQHSIAKTYALLLQAVLFEVSRTDPPDCPDLHLCHISGKEREYDYKGILLAE